MISLSLFWPFYPFHWAISKARSNISVLSPFNQRSWRRFESAVLRERHKIYSERNAQQQQQLKKLRNAILFPFSPVRQINADCAPEKALLQEWRNVCLRLCVLNKNISAAKRADNAAARNSKGNSFLLLNSPSLHKKALTFNCAACISPNEKQTTQDCI